MPEELALEEGDIVLTTSGDVVSWFFTLAVRDENSQTITDFSHAEMVFRNDKGQLMLGGVFGGQVNGAPLNSRLQMFQKFAVFRAHAPFEKRQKAATILQGWLKDRTINEAEFDYSMNYEPGKRDQLFCAGLVSEAYRLAGIGLPFGLRSWSPNELTFHIEEIINTKLKNLLDVSTIFNSEHFQLVVQWENDQINAEQVLLSKKIVLYLIEQYMNGWKLKVSDGFHLILSVFSPSQIEEQFGRLQISINGLRDDVFKVWDRLSRRGVLESMSKKEKDDLFTEICDRFRTDYFTPINSSKVAVK